MNNNGAAIGATAPAEDTAPETNSVEDTAPVDDDNDNSERESGVGQKVHEMFNKYIESLTPAAADCVRPLFNVHTGIWDDDCLQIAEAELQTVEFTYDFAELFKKAAKDKVKPTVEVTELRLACQNWINITTAQPKRIEEAESAIGDLDSALKKASQAGDADGED